MTQYIVCAMYKFVALENFKEMRQPLLDVMLQNHIKGTLLLASEGINGTISGPREGIDALLAYLNSDARLNPISYKESLHNEQPFYRTKVKLKKEIVTLGVEGIDPNQSVGTYVKPKDWNALISDPEVFVVDTRNDYEIEIGTFKHAVDPNTKTFREFPEYVAQNMDPAKHKKVAMFCTGGIRCEKSTAFMKQQGFSEVYHLEGGILQYLGMCLRMRVYGRVTASCLTIVSPLITTWKKVITTSVMAVAYQSRKKINNHLNMKRA
jgi:UPF0176 protein